MSQPTRFDRERRCTSTALVIKTSWNKTVGEKSEVSFEKKIYDAWYSHLCLEQVLYWISNLYLFKNRTKTRSDKNTWNLFIYFIFVKFTTNFLDFLRKISIMEIFGIRFDTLRNTLFSSWKFRENLSVDWRWFCVLIGPLVVFRMKSVVFELKSMFLTSTFWPQFAILTKSNHVIIVTLI